MAWNKPRWYDRVLEPIAEVYRGVTESRRQAYEVGKKRQQILPRPVISIGNLTVGGTGKTPLVMYLAKKLSSWCHVAVLTRGYGRTDKRSYLVVPKPSMLDERAALFFGDEPVMMSKHLKNTSIHVGPNRYKNGLTALRNHPVDVFLMDDGFQHVNLYRNLDIVLLDGEEELKTLKPLPAGPLREPLEALRRADILFVNHCGLDGECKVDLEHIKNYCPNAPVVKGRYAVTGLVDCITGEKYEIEQLKKKPLFAFCAIAKPDKFMDKLSESGLDVVGKRFFMDHHRFTGRDVRSIMNEAMEAGAEALVVTEKDSVRIKCNKIRGLAIYYLAIELQIIEGEEKMWERVGEVLNVD